MPKYIKAKKRIFIIGPSGHGKSVGDTCHIVATTFSSKPLSEVYDLDLYQEVNSTGSLVEAKALAKKYGSLRPKVI